jgi:hypothetical protein
MNSNNLLHHRQSHLGERLGERHHLLTRAPPSHHLRLFLVNLAQEERHEFTLTWMSCLGWNLSKTNKLFLSLLRSDSFLVGLILNRLCFTCLFLL